MTCIYTYMDNHKVMGTIGESLVVTQVLENQNNVFTEFGDNCKVDLIVMDSEGTLHKVQVKASDRETRSPDVTKLYMKKKGPNGHRYTYTKEDVDWFAVVDMPTKKIAWIKCCNIEVNELSLRHTEPKSKIKSRMFDEYTNYPFN
mgnify:CR=1 FL=1